ncbi:phytanoyl-CoA dioxygenase family protein [Catenulispora rubra]|uniref:phytanoyl-CoA dioxygenase family protein n=1 Tax=Catenulispora rubra TaxID=280293 RepID=UPI001892443E|nr:phytanoyl-CoA dioxygenase family protein [Catenulispora rubra]
MLSEEQLKEFGERGYLVVPGVVDAEIVERASRRIDELIAAKPPAEGHVGHHFYFPVAADEPALIEPLMDAGFAYAEALTEPGLLEEPQQVQVALNIPPFSHQPGRPHIDAAISEPTPGFKPNSFTLLAGVFVTDQTTENSGNLWVWPGTHLTHAEYFRERGVEMYCAYPDIKLPEPEQVTARAGDLLLAHYLLGHNIGGNYESDTTRRMLYYRVSGRGHAEGPERILTEPWHEYGAVRALM